MSRIIGVFFDSTAAVYAPLRVAFPVLEFWALGYPASLEACKTARVFLFDYTAARRHIASPLEELSRIRRLNPSTPLIVAAEEGDLAAMLLAFRLARIWDYAAMPREMDYLISRTHDAINLDNSRLARSIVFPNSNSQAQCEKQPVVRCSTGKALTYIESHYRRRLPIEEVAAQCGLGVDTFSRKFSLDNGMSFREYLKRTRLNAARHFLKETQLSIEQIAYKVGYEDSSV